jgi:antitoxin (DNA-binding transcriptional repressor) of toxin-antitoxin stability system
MHSMNLRQLRDTRQLKAWLKAGEAVELRERDQVLTRIVPEEGTFDERQARLAEVSELNTAG